MATDFYLADERYMSEEEIGNAQHFNEDAFVCRQYCASEGKLGYTLGINLSLLHTLPVDTKLLNNNNCLNIRTIEDLLDAINKSSIIETPEEKIRNDKEYVKMLISRPDNEQTYFFKYIKDAVKNGMPLDSYFHPSQTAEQYITRFNTDIDNSKRIIEAEKIIIDSDEDIFDLKF